MVLTYIKNSLKLILILSFCCSFSADDNHWLNKNGLKKLEKSLCKTWGSDRFEKKHIYIANEKLSELNLKKNSLFEISIDKELKGYLFLDTQRSKFDTFDYMVIFNKDLSIKKADILVYREAYGGEICSKVFLKQFQGKNNQSKIKIGDDIQGISGATISCRAAVQGIKSLTKKAVILKEEGYF